MANRCCRVHSDHHPFAPDLHICFTTRLGPFSLHSDTFSILHPLRRRWVRARVVLSCGTPPHPRTSVLHSCALQFAGEAVSVRGLLQPSFSS
jgi:hypothetical protein